MYYVYRKRDGSILSASISVPIVQADRETGIAEFDTSLPRRDWPNFVIKNGELKKRDSSDARRRTRVRVEERTKRAIEAKNGFWAIVDDENATADDLREALRILGEYVFPRGRVRSGS